MARKKATTAQLLPGVLLDNDQVRLEMVFERGEDCEKLTPTHKDKPQSYFNFTPKGRLASMLVGYLEGYIPGTSVPLHRAIVAASGRFVSKDCDIHHIDGNHHNNRADNLEPVDRMWHLEHHAKQPRLANDPQLSLFSHRSGLSPHLRVTFRERPATPPGVYEASAEGSGGWRDYASLNPRHLSDAGVSLLESSFEVPGDPVGLPEYRRRTWKARELQRLGLTRQVANAAGWMLRAVRKLGSNARAGQIVPLVTAKGVSLRTAYRALDWLLLEGFIEKHDTRFYRLTDAAWVVESTRRRMG